MSHVGSGFFQQIIMAAIMTEIPLKLNLHQLLKFGRVIIIQVIRLATVQNASIQELIIQNIIIFG